MKAALALSFLLMCSVSRADVYVLGSSFSNDALPYALDDRPQWHIDCGKPLQFIYDNPLSPCELGSTIWPVALTTTRFDYVSFQPVAGPGITQQSDLDAIGFWMSLQPDAIVVIHPTWPSPSAWESVFHDSNPDQTFTNYSRAYYYDLINRLQTAYPGRIIVTDRVNEMLDSIYHDIQNGVGPLTDFQQMFRDEGGHASDYGHYLLHNALRQAFDQRTGIDNTPLGVEHAIEKYLDAKIRACRPLSSLADRRHDACRPVVPSVQTFPIPSISRTKLTASPKGDQRLP